MSGDGPFKTCGKCDMERATNKAGTKMGPHRRWDKKKQMMVRCEGTGEPPKRAGLLKALLGG